jgi:hypothetical protein
MPELPSRPCRILPALVAALAGGVVGCGGGEGIRSYTVPKTTEPKVAGVAADQPGEGKPEVRLLAAAIPAGDDRSYFVKLLGPADVVTEHEAAFDAFLNSIRVTNDPAKPVTWTPPPGGRQLPARSMRLATFTLGPPGRSVDLYVSTPFGGSRRDNVNRWRRQDVGLKEVTEAEVPSVVTEIDLGGTKAYRVDYRGPGGTGGMGGSAPFMKGR